MRLCVVFTALLGLAIATFPRSNTGYYDGSSGGDSSGGAIIYGSRSSSGSDGSYYDGTGSSGSGSGYGISSSNDGGELDELLRDLATPDISDTSGGSSSNGNRGEGSWVNAARSGRYVRFGLVSGGSSGISGDSSSYHNPSYYRGSGHGYRTGGYRGGGVRDIVIRGGGHGGYRRRHHQYPYYPRYRYHYRYPYKRHGRSHKYRRGGY